jgi:hypothetical protein
MVRHRPSIDVVNVELRDPRARSPEAGNLGRTPTDDGDVAARDGSEGCEGDIDLAFSVEGGHEHGGRLSGKGEGEIGHEREV